MLFEFMKRAVFDMLLITQAPRSYGRLLQVKDRSSHHALRDQRALLVRPS